MTLPPLPILGGSYRWFYADAHAGDFTAVCIFMIGAVFSPRAEIAARRGVPPLAHCAVNCALYHRGRRRAWVFTEHAGATVAGDVLRIGGSTFGYAADGSVRLAIVDRTAPFGRRLRLSLVLQPAASPAPTVLLHAAGAHEWQAVVPRARARLELPDDEVAVDGVGYHDTNHGARRLGSGLPGWSWTRVHAPSRTIVRYRLPAPSPTIVVRENDGDVHLASEEPRSEPMRRSPWGLAHPQRLAAGDLDPGPPRVLESSPFYARLEATDGDRHALGEVADFRRFAQPWVRWMAHFRLRVERAA